MKLSYLEDFMNQLPELRSARPLGANRWILEPISDDTDLRPHLMRWAVDNNIIIKTMQREEVTMEEAFQELTKEE